MDWAEIARMLKVVIPPLLAVFAVMAAGAAARKINWLSEEADGSLLKLTINLLFPALIFLVIVPNPSLRDIRTLTVPPLIGFVTLAGGILLALLVARIGGPAIGLGDQAQQRTFALCIGVYNYIYIPLPLIAALFDQRTAAMLFIHNIGVEIAMWTVGVLVISGRLGRRWYKSILNIPSISIVLALALNWTVTPLYQRIVPHWPSLAGAMGVVETALEMMGRTAVPLALLLIGATAVDQLRHTPAMSGKRVVLAGTLLRLGILPALFLLIAWCVPRGLPLAAQLRQVIAVQAAMPCAMFPIIMSRHYGGHPPTALRVVLGTSIASLFATPLWLAAAKAMGLW